MVKVTINPANSLAYNIGSLQVFGILNSSDLGGHCGYLGFREGSFGCLFLVCRKLTYGFERIHVTSQYIVHLTTL